MQEIKRFPLEHGHAGCQTILRDIPYERFVKVSLHIAIRRWNVHTNMNTTRRQFQIVPVFSISFIKRWHINFLNAGRGARLGLVYGCNPLQHQRTISSPATKAIDNLNFDNCGQAYKRDDLIKVLDNSKTVKCTILISLKPTNISDCFYLCGNVSPRKSLKWNELGACIVIINLFALKANLPIRWC